MVKYWEPKKKTYYIIWKVEYIRIYRISYIILHFKLNTWKPEWVYLYWRTLKSSVSSYDLPTVNHVASYYFIQTCT